MYTLHDRRGSEKHGSQDSSVQIVFLLLIVFDTSRVLVPSICLSLPSFKLCDRTSVPILVFSRFLFSSLVFSAPPLSLLLGRIEESDLDESLPD